MPLVPKIDPNKIFASNAPTQDKPAAFSNYEKGMDETRKNLGRPTIPQLNYLHQTADQKILWIHQNGGGLPYDASIEYAEKSVTVKDGELKQLVGGAWVEVKTKALPATAITTASNQNQQEINDFGGAKWRNKPLGYDIGATVKLTNGDIVKSTVANNTNNPNVDMTGWAFASRTMLQSIADMLAISNPKDGSSVYVKAYEQGTGLGGGDLIFDATSAAIANDVTIFGVGVGRWIRPLDTVITPYHAGAVTGQDSIEALEKFGEAFRLSGEKSRYLAVGYFKISRPWNFVMKTAGELTWFMKLEATQAMKYATALRGVGMTHLGKLAVVGQGSDNNYDTFTLGYGVVINGCQSSSLPEFSIQRIKYFGVITDETSSISEIPLGGLAFANNTMMNTPLIFARDTGCSTFGLSKNKTITTTFSNPIHAGANGSSGQNTTITLSDNVINNSELVIGDFFAVINNKTYQIVAVDNTTNTIQLFPWLDTTEPTSGSINFFWGGVIKTSGSNVGPLKVGKLDAQRGGIGILEAGLFGSVYIDTVVQFLCVGQVIGVSSASLAPQSTSAIGFYTEGTYRNVILVSQGSAQYLNRMGEFNGAAFVKCEKIRANSRNGDGGAFYDVDGWKRVFMPTQDGNGLDGIYYKGRGKNQDLSGSAIQLSPRNIAPRIYKRDGWTVSLQESEVANRTKGLDDAVIGFIGSGNNGEPTGTFTFNPPVGWTVNGGASAVFNGFSNPPIFLCCWEIATKNIVVRNSSGGLRQATAVYDPPSIPANGRTSTTVTLTGAVLGDDVSASINRSRVGLQLNPYVSAPDTVTVDFINGTAAAIDLATLTLKVKII